MLLASHAFSLHARIRNTPYVWALLLIPLLLMVGGCRPLTLTLVNPDGPPEYRVGWEDGCDTGMSAIGDWGFKNMFGFKKRDEFAVQPGYKDGWNDGYTYCRFTLATNYQPGNWEDVGL